MSKEASKKAGRLSITTLLIIALVLFVLGVLLAILPTYSFIRNFAVGTLHPLEVFDSGEAVEFIDDNPYSGYLLSVEVDELSAPLPEMNIVITTSDGTSPQTSEINRWNTLMGRDYKQFLMIEPPADGLLNIQINTPENEDFLIYRRIDDVLEREIRRTLPEWTVSSIPILGSLAILMRILIRMITTSSNLDLEFE